MTTQQQEPILAMTAAQWNIWFVRSFDNCMNPHMEAINRAFGDIAKAMNENADDTNAALDDIVQGEVGRAVSMQHKKISELLEILGLLVKGKGNEFVAGRVAQMTKEFKHQTEIKHEVATVETTTVEQQRTQRVQQVVRTIDQILAH